jgi:hypothetical protein
VFAVVSDARRWHEWTFVPRSELEREGEPAPDGVGAMRKLGRAPFISREEVVAYEPPRRYGYVLRSGLPVRSYRAEVLLEPDGTGTAITWTGHVEPLPATGPAMGWFLGRMLQGFATNAARHAERPT